jgi:hypothetical protein
LAVNSSSFQNQLYPAKPTSASPDHPSNRPEPSQPRWKNRRGRSEQHNGVASFQSLVTNTPSSSHTCRTSGTCRFSPK